MSDLVRRALATIVDGGTLAYDEARLAMGAVMDGEATVRVPRRRRPAKS